MELVLNGFAVAAGIAGAVSIWVLVAQVREVCREEKMARSNDERA